MTVRIATECSLVPSFTMETNKRPMLLYAESGHSFVASVKQVQEILKRGEDYCDLEFNEIRIRVSKDSKIDDLCTIYDLKHKIKRLEAGYKD